MRFRFPRISDARDHILTALLLVLAVGLMVARHDGAMRTVRAASITVFSYLEEPLAHIRIYREALKTNTYLRKQNVMLLDEMSRMRAAYEQNKRLRELLNMQRSTDLDLIPAVFIGKELTALHNSLTVDVGSNEGVKNGMPVISGDGLVGKVILTGPNYAQVMPIYNTTFNVSARVQSSQAYGIVSWTGERYGEMVMNYVPQTIRVDTGAVVETSGYSNQYPPGLPIGTITRVEPVEGKETQKLFLKPYVDLFSLTEGFVVNFEPDTAVTNLKERYHKLFQ